MSKTIEQVRDAKVMAEINICRVIFKFIQENNVDISSVNIDVRKVFSEGNDRPADHNIRVEIRVQI